jgi:hypothetical protein
VSLSAEIVSVKTPRYEIIADSGAENAARLAHKLDKRFALFDSVFRFDEHTLQAPLKVRSFCNKDQYDQYVSEQLNAQYPAGAVYIHYAQPDRRELVVHRGSADKKQLIAHQAFVQYLRAFVPEPPAWLLEGFAQYFTYWSFDDRTELVQQNDWEWHETVKPLVQNPDLWTIISTMLSADSGAPELHALSIAFVSFLMDQQNTSYYRTLVESFMLLSQEASAAENTAAVANHIERWTDKEAFVRDFSAYMAQRKTFSELITEGQQAYAAGDTARATRLFDEAKERQSDHYVPYYYIGLIAYESHNYVRAEQYFRQSLDHGLDEATACYALGVNAIRANRATEGKSFLERAATLDPERYQTKVREVLYPTQKDN